MDILEASFRGRKTPLLMTATNLKASILFRYTYISVQGVYLKFLAADASQVDIKIIS